MVTLLLELGGMKDIPDVNKRTPISIVIDRNDKKIKDIMTESKRTNCRKRLIWEIRNQPVQQFPFQGKREIQKDRRWMAKCKETWIPG